MSSLYSRKEFVDIHLEADMRPPHLGSKDFKCLYHNFFPLDNGKPSFWNKATRI